MDGEISLLAEIDENIPALDAPDDVLERAAGVGDGRSITWAYCTNWYLCGWPR